jgi:hypothetical protein
MRWFSCVYGSTTGVTCGKTVLKDNGATQLPFGGASFFNNVSSGTNTISITASAYPTTTFAPLSESMGTGSYYSDFVMGLSGVASTDPSYPVQVFTDDDRSSPGNGNARMRVIDAAPDAGTIDVRRNSMGFVSDIHYMYAGDMNEFSAGTQNMTVTVHGSPSTILATSSVTVNAGQFYTLVVLEAKPGGVPTYSIVVTNDSQS